MRLNAPIALFVYNRPRHTQLTLEALARNHGARDSHLCIFADGPADTATAEDYKNIEAVRCQIREKAWCGSMEIVESDTNLGLAESITGGISRALVDHDRVIVMEDDLETSPGFLRYMNDALNLYLQEERVFQVSAFMVRARPWRPQTGFLRVSSSWGWGTWRRAWRHYRSDAGRLLEEVRSKGRSQFDLDGCSFHFEELERNVDGDLATWAVKWYASIFLQSGLCLYPRKSLVRNIGFDGSGANCHNDITDYHRKLRLARSIRVRPQPVEETKSYLEAMQAHYRYLLRLWTGTRLRDRVRRKLGFLVS